MALSAVLFSSDTLFSYATGNATLTQQQPVTNNIGATAADAASLGTLTTDQTQLNVAGQITGDNQTDYYSFVLDGSSLKAAFNNITNTAALQVQITDSSGNVIADNQGTPEQQVAFNALTQPSGLNASPDTYQIKVTYAPGLANHGITQAYGLSLYSGTNFSQSYFTNAVTQTSSGASTSTTAGATASGGIVLYQRNAVNPLNATPATAVNIGNLVTNQTQLIASGQVAATNQTSYYTFNLQGNTLSAVFQNATDSATSADLEVQITDSKGNIIADNQGTALQQIAFQDLSQGPGLSATPGQYNVKVTYAPLAPKTALQNYTLTLNSGTSFSQTYQTTAPAQLAPTTYVPVDNTQVYQTSDAQLYSRSAYNTIGATAASGVNIGWLYQNKQALAVTSQLTTADSADFYQLTLQQGNNLKLAFNDTNTGTTATGVRVQLYDATGTYLLADSGGTAAQQKAYAQLTSSTGLAAQPGNYAVKVSYAAGADTSKTQNYNFQLYSGDYFTSQYTTTASAQTLGNAILSGNTAVVGYSSASSIASYVQNFVNGTDSTGSSLFTALSAFV